MSTLLRRVFGPLSVVVLALAMVLPAQAIGGPPPVTPNDLRLPAGTGGAVVDSRLAQASGVVEIVVRLGDVSLSEAHGRNAKQRGGALSGAQQRAYVRTLTGKQEALLRDIRQLGGVEIARLSKSLNAVIVRVDAARIPVIATLPNVRTIRPVGTYELDLSSVVEQVGAAAVQALDVDGSGVRVAVLDSGIDYTHRNLGGPGTVEDYEAAYGTDPADPRNTTRDGLFPTAKVVEGYDFVGEQWPSGPRTEDSDPIDFQGHGTHVADIIAGHSSDGLHKGVAPGASLLAVKVCSAVATSCNGVALLLAMEYVLDPNGDGAITDAVDVVNMSLGSSYGQREDDLSEAAANAVRLGVIVVVSAGNSGDRPYIAGSPSTTPEVISVAQTQVPSAKLYVITVGTQAVSGLHQDWSAAPATASGALAYDTSTGAKSFGCSNAAGANPYVAGEFAGKVLLMDRGVCAVSMKVANAAAAGAIAAIIANNVAQAPGDLPPSFSYGGGNASIPGYVVTLTDGNKLRTVVGQTATIDLNSFVSLAQTIVATSSRGPSYSYSAIKPDIGAPGAAMSAEVGTGDGETAFGGTSGAAPVVSGAAALLIQQYPARTPVEIKALLMNTGETTIALNPAALPGVLAPITRIGGGEVRVDRALASTTAAWDTADEAGSLSFGYRTVVGSLTLRKTITVRNYSAARRTYNVAAAFRYADDATSNAVRVSVPSSVTVPANGSRNFQVVLTVDAARLPIWNLNGGPSGGNGSLLQGVEFDGYINIASAADNVHLAWQILPHRAANVTPSPNTNQINLNSANRAIRLRNSGTVAGRVESFSLTGTSPEIKKKNLPAPGDNYAVIDLRAVGVRQVNANTAQFAITTFGARAHPAYPAEFDIYIDSNRDGAADYVIYTAELGAFGSTGETVVNVVNLATQTGAVYFYADADLNSANVIMTVPLVAIGLTPATQFDFSVYAFDNYFTGNLTDAIENMTYTLGTPRYTASGVPASGVPARATSTLTFEAVTGGDTASPSQSGILLLYRDAQLKREAEVFSIKP